MQTRKWRDQSGQDQYSTEVVLQGFHAQLIMLDSRIKSADAPDRGGDVGCDEETDFDLSGFSTSS